MSTQSTPPDVRPLTVSIADAARALSLSRATLYRIVRQGDLKTYKVGRRTLIRYEDLERLRDRMLAGRVSLSTPTKTGRAALASAR